MIRVNRKFILLVKIYNKLIIIYGDCPHILFDDDDQKQIDHFDIGVLTRSDIDDAHVDVHDQFDDLILAHDSDCGIADDHEHGGNALAHAFALGYVHVHAHVHADDCGANAHVSVHGYSIVEFQIFYFASY